MHFKLIAKLFIWFAFIFGHAEKDKHEIKDLNEKPFYLLSFTIRGIAAILHGILFDPHNGYDYLPIFLFQVSSFFLFFSPLLNMLRHLPLLYAGKKSGWFDPYFNKYKWLHIAAILASMAIMAQSIIVLIHRV